MKLHHACPPLENRMLKENCLTYYHRLAIFLFSKLCICLKLEVHLKINAFPTLSTKEAPKNPFCLGFFFFKEPKLQVYADRSLHTLLFLWRLLL